MIEQTFQKIAKWAWDLLNEAAATMPHNMPFIPFVVALTEDDQWVFADLTDLLRRRLDDLEYVVDTAERVMRNYKPLAVAVVYQIDVMVAMAEHAAGLMADTDMHKRFKAGSVDNRDLPSTARIETMLVMHVSDGTDNRHVACEIARVDGVPPRLSRWTLPPAIDPPPYVDAPQAAMVRHKRRIIARRRPGHGRKGRYDRN